MKKPYVLQGYTTSCAYETYQPDVAKFFEKIIYWWFNLLYFTKLKETLMQTAAETLKNTIIYTFQEQQNKRYEIKLGVVEGLFGNISGYDYNSDLIHESRKLIFSKTMERIFGIKIYNWIERYTGKIIYEIENDCSAKDFKPLFRTIFMEEAAIARNKRHQYYPARVNQMAAAISQRMKILLINTIGKLEKM